MKLTNSNRLTHNRKGFTLIEVIASITVSAILAVILVQFFKVQSAQSWIPIRNLNQSLALKSAMDQMTSDYRSLLITEDTPLVILQQNIDSGDYWDANDNIQVEMNHCIEFAPDGPGQWREDQAHTPCAHTEDTSDTDDTLLKVTLSSGDQNLTSLFTR